MMRFILFLTITALPQLLDAGLREQVDSILSEQVNNATWSMEQYTIPKDIKAKVENMSGQKFLKDFVYLWTINTADSLYGYAIVDAVKAKSAFITTMILINTEGKIERLEILDYKGAHGHAVNNEAWLAQFKGKSDLSYFTLGMDIDAATGATYSSRALSRGAKRWILLASFLLK